MYFLTEILVYVVSIAFRKFFLSRQTRLIFMQLPTQTFIRLLAPFWANDASYNIMKPLHILLLICVQQIAEFKPMQIVCTTLVFVNVFLALRPEIFHCFFQLLFSADRLHRVREFAITQNLHYEIEYLPRLGLENPY